MSATELFFDIVRQLDSHDGSEKLVKADIYGANIADAGALRLASSLFRNSSLKILNAGSNCIGDDGGAAIAKALQTNTILHTLYLHENSIGDDAVFCFEQSLGRFNTTLNVLDISSNAINNKSASALANIFKSQSNLNGNSSLTELYLRNNQIGNASAIEFSKILLTNATLVILDISHNRVTDAGGSSFAQALYVNTHLQTLNLSFNRLSQSIGDQFLSVLTKRSELVKVFVEGQSISHDTVARILALGPQPPAPPAKWARPSAQGVMAALATQMKSSKFSCLKKKLKIVGAFGKSGSDDHADKTISCLKADQTSNSQEKTTHVPKPVQLSKCKAVPKSSRGSKKIRPISACILTRPAEEHSVLFDNTVTSRIKGSNFDDPDVVQKLSVPSESVEKQKQTLSTFKAKFKSISAFTKSGVENRSQKCIAVDKTTDAVKSNLNSENSASIPFVITSPVDRDDQDIFRSETAIRSAKMQASGILSDAQAIATDIIMEAQKQLARVLVVSKDKPVRFHVAEEIAASLSASKSKLADSLRSEFLYARKAAIAADVLCTEEKLTVENAPQITAGSNERKSATFVSAPAGFQKCQLPELIQNPICTPPDLDPPVDDNDMLIIAAQEFKHEDLETSTIPDSIVLLELPAVSSNQPSEKHMDILRSFIISRDASPEDLLLQKSIDFIPLNTLPYLELGHLSDLFHTEDAISILQNEITGPMWHIKMKPTDNTELKPLPKFVAVKQYFEELNAVFQEEFLFLNAIHGQHCVTITHVLGRQGVPVGLLMEHLPLLLDEAMEHFSLSVAVSVLVKCAAAIHSLHISNVVHSNINTSSFILSSDFCSVKLAEFAIDQCILSSLGFLHKQEPFFAAPEMSGDGAIPTALTDIYAFGALTWRLMHPLSMLPNGNAPIAVSLAAARGSLPLFTAAGVPISICDVCHRCMSRDPHSRPQSMLDVMLVLSAVQSTLESSN
jgi:hypothetical protein